MSRIDRIAARLRAPAYATDATPRHTPPAQFPAPLLDSPLGSANRRALDLLHAEMHADPSRHFWLALVPGTSEQWGHHRAPPREQEQRGVRISTEFERRLERAAKLLRAGVVRFVLISGGSVDARRPDYNEALRGRDHLLAAWPALSTRAVSTRAVSTRAVSTRAPEGALSAGAVFTRAPEGALSADLGDLADRVLVDPLASTSVSNVRNADKLCLDVGLDRLLIATTMPPNAKIWPANLPVVHQTSQGWYFLHHRLSTYDARCRRLLGYTLGAFEWFEVSDSDAGGGGGEGEQRVQGERVTAIAHHGFDPARLAGDDYGP